MGLSHQKMGKMKQPKVLLFDIEATNLSANFGYTIAFGYKWLGEKTTKVLSIADYKKTFGQDCTNDKELMKDVAPIIESADVLVGWYSTRFDIPFLQTRRLLHGLSPIGEPPHVDGWWIARKRLKFTSNRLVTVSASIPIEENQVKQYKTPLSSHHWIRGAAGHLPSISYIVQHCRQDVKVLEQVWNKIKGFAKTLPNMSLLTNGGKRGCSACGAPETESEKRGFYATSAMIKQRHKCFRCGHWYLLNIKKI